MGLRSPVSCANPTTSDEAMVFDKVSVMPTERSSKYKMRKSNIINHLNGLNGRDASQMLELGNAWEAWVYLRAEASLDDSLLWNQRLCPAPQSAPSPIPSKRTHAPRQGLPMPPDLPGELCEFQQVATWRVSKDTPVGPDPDPLLNARQRFFVLCRKSASEGGIHAEITGR
jgi:hypothetical protein